MVHSQESVGIIAQVEYSKELHKSSVLDLRQIW